MNLLRLSVWGRWTYAFIVLALILGGASSSAHLANTALRVVAVIFGYFAWIRIAKARAGGATHTPGMRFASMILALSVLLVGLQLVPLPSGVWASLPGRAQLAADAALLGVAPAAPLSLAPLATFDTLLWMVVPAVAFAAMLTVPKEDRRLFPILVVAMAAFSIFIGFLQSAGVEQLRFFGRFTASGEPIGWFRNRNHQGLMMALAVAALGFGILPLLRDRIKVVIGWAAIAAFVLFAILTGSRAAMGLAALTAAAAAFAAMRRGHTFRLGTVPVLLGSVGIVAIFFALISLTPQFARLTDKTATFDEDVRVQAAIPTLRIAGEFFPTGVGFGAFDPVFRWQVPEQAAGQYVINHAHNDYLELAMTGGLPAVLLLVAFVVWLMMRVPAAHAAEEWMRNSRMVALAIIALIMAHSIVDYPLRTAAIASLFAAACAMLIDPLHLDPARRRGGSSRPKRKTGKTTAKTGGFDISALGSERDR